MSMEQIWDAIGNLEHRVKKLEKMLGSRKFTYEHTMDGVYLYVSPEVEDILGVSPDQFLKTNKKHITQEYGNKVHECVLGGQEAFSLQTMMLDKDGNHKMLSIMEKPYMSDDGEIIVWGEARLQN